MGKSHTNALFKYQKMYNLFFFSFFLLKWLLSWECDINQYQIFNKKIHRKEWMKYHKSLGTQKIHLLVFSIEIKTDTFNNDISKNYFPWKTHLWFWMIDKYHKKQHYLSNNTNSTHFWTFQFCVTNMKYEFFGLFEYDYNVMIVFGRNNYNFGVLTVNRVRVFQT